MDEAALFLFVRVEELHQQFGPQRAGAQRVDADVFAGMDHRQFTGHG